MTHRGLGPLAAVGAGSFTLVWFVLGFVSDGYTMWDITVDSYSAVAQPISGLGLGSTAPVMNAAFVLGGLLITIGTWSATAAWPRTRALRWARPMIVVSGLGMAMCGIFDLEAIMLHTLGFLLGAGLPGVGFVIAGIALRGTAHAGLARWLRLAGPLTLVGFVAYLATFDPEAAGDNVGYAGLTERLLLLVLMAALAAIGLERQDRGGRGARRAVDLGQAHAG